LTKPCVFGHFPQESALFTLDSNMNTLPIIVAARNEEESIENTLCSFSRAAEQLCLENPGTRVIVILCDNGSKDGTRSKVLSCAGAFRTDRFEIVLIDEPKAGKMNALLKAIGHLRSLNLNPPAVVFADAEIQWDSDTLSELWKYWRMVHGKADLVGAIMERNRTGPENIWEALESVYYIGYGQGFQGHGVFVREVIGMTYLCDARILPRFFKIPDEIAEDFAISYLVGRSRLHVCPTARVKYTVCNTMGMFFKVKGRHVQECYRLRNWVAKRIFSRLPQRRQHLWAYIFCYRRARTVLAGFVETRTLHVVKGLFTHFREIASPQRLFVALVLMFPIYTILKFRACYDLMFGKAKAGWLPYRR
jgi:cellulose synthase/poly-beta-1,6-N-acetylglucosamine synthase-like glycosyltransferase